MPAEYAVRGLHSVTMSERLPEPPTALLTELLGMRPAGEYGDRARFAMADGGAGAVVDVVADRRPARPAGRRHGAPHRVPRPGRATQELWREQLVDAGRQVTEIIDRQYFTSIYFREPGGVLLEIATDPPGFPVDEPLLELGRSLKLPPWLEPGREQIAAALPPLRVDPAAGGSTA